MKIIFQSNFYNSFLFGFINVFISKDRKILKGEKMLDILYKSRLTSQLLINQKEKMLNVDKQVIMS